MLDVFGGTIDLDPCSNTGSIVPATRRVSLPENGLKVPWDVRRTYMNPPYGRPTVIAPWTDNAAFWGDDEFSVFGLLPARTSNIWWHEDVGVSSAICHVRGRIHFIGSKHGAPFPSAFVLWGREFVERFIRLTAKVGLVDVRRAA